MRQRLAPPSAPDIEMAAAGVTQHNLGSLYAVSSKLADEASGQARAETSLRTRR